MRNDQIFVLLLVILLPMSGCFDGAVGDAEGTDDASENGDTSGGDGTSTGTASSTQERTWYSSGGTFAATWSDGSEVGSGSQKCMEWGPSYDPQTGDYLGEECRRYGYPDRASDWNVTECTDVGGTPFWYQLSSYEHHDGDNNSSTNYAYRWAPNCIDIPLATINTVSGEALIIYQWNGASLTTTCNGVRASNPYLSSVGGTSGLESVVVQGSAMDCTHEITRSMPYSDSAPNYAIWSVVYAIQDVTVV